jgi:ferric-dicitrate binding protein FerR (iron transport regulator)
MSKNYIGVEDWLSYTEPEVTADQLTRAESRLLARIREVEKRSHRRIVGRRYAVAAAVLLLVAGAWLLRTTLIRPQPVLHTAYGEVKENLLPDGSSVVVNANSKLRFSSGWKDGRDREVWLTGEAFFHVAKTPLRSRFIVHVRHFDIIVTGTQFNVVNRQDKANVTLKEGSVLLHTDEGKELRMAPGDFVEYTGDRLSKRTVKADSVIAWREHQLVLNGTPLRELIGVMRENFGVTVITSGPAVEEKKIYAIIQTNNLDLLLATLQATGDFGITRQGDTIMINDHSK